jgi:hypothetical protein
MAFLAVVSFAFSQIPSMTGHWICRLQSNGFSCNNKFLPIDIIQLQNSKVNNVSNIIIIKKTNTKSNVGKHGPPTNAKVGSGAAEE